MRGTGMTWSVCVCVCVCVLCVLRACVCACVRAGVCMHAARLFSHLRFEAIWTTFGLLGLEMLYFLKGFCARRTRPFRPIWSGLLLPVAHQQEAVPPPPVPFFCRSSCCLRTGVACASTDAQTHATELHSGHRGGATSNCGRRRTRRTDKYKRGLNAIFSGGSLRSSRCQVQSRPGPGKSSSRREEHPVWSDSARTVQCPGPGTMPSPGPCCGPYGPSGPGQVGPAGGPLTLRLALTPERWTEEQATRSPNEQSRSCPLYWWLPVHFQLTDQTSSWAPETEHTAQLENGKCRLLDVR